MRRLRAVPAALACAATLIGCGGAATTSDSGQTTRTKPARRAAGPASRLTVSATVMGALPAAVEDPAVASLDGGAIALLGGLDAAITSTDAITVLSGTHAASRGTLPQPQHDAQAARIGHYVYVFGGGESSSFDHILRYDVTTESVTQAGALPKPASDVAVTALAGTAYIVGGYDGSNWLDTIVAWRPGIPPRVVARLPFGLRYAAVAPAGARLIIAGGTKTDGVSNAILSFDPATASVKVIGRLPVSLTHASSAVLDGKVLVIGGRRQVDGDQTNTVLTIDPASGHVRHAGKLPQPLSDAAAAAIGGEVVVAGGDDGGVVQRAILALTAQKVSGSR